MLTIQVAFPIDTFSADEEALVYGALVTRIMRETVGDPSALLAGEAAWVTGDTVPVALAVTYAPDMGRVEEMVTGLVILAESFAQPVVTVALANLEFFGSGAPTYLSSPGYPAEDDATVIYAADLDAWEAEDDELDALARELSAFYGNDEDVVAPLMTEAETDAFLASILAEGFPPEAE